MRERTNEEWVCEPRASPPGCDAAFADLRAFILAKLHFLFRRNSSFDTGFVDDIAQESLLKTVEKIDTFRGESRFTSWALRIAVNLAYSELRRREHRNVSLDITDTPDLTFGAELLSDRSDDPTIAAAKRAIVETQNLTIASSLTERQRITLAGMMEGRLPLDELAQRLDTNRNALCKLPRDARLKLKRALEEAGYSAAGVAALVDSPR